MAKIRLEWVRQGRPEFQRGMGEALAGFSGQQTITVLSSPVLSGSAPAFTGADGVANGQGLARVTVLSGAVVVAWGGASPTVSETTGVRLEAGQVQLFSVDTGDALSFIEAQDGPSPRAVQDVALETALQGTLSVVSSPIHAISTGRSGALIAANVAQDLMPANAARNGWTIQNQSSGPLYARSKGAAGATPATLDQNSLMIPPGASYDPPKITPHALSIIGATTGQAFFAEEW